MKFHFLLHLREVFEQDGQYGSRDETANHYHGNGGKDELRNISAIYAFSTEGERCREIPHAVERVEKEGGIHRQGKAGDDGVGNVIGDGDRHPCLLGRIQRGWLGGGLMRFGLGGFGLV